MVCSSVLALCNSSCVAHSSALVLRNSSPQGEGRYTFRFEGKDRYYFSIENSRDGGRNWQKFMEGNYKRV